MKAKVWGFGSAGGTEKEERALSKLFVLMNDSIARICALAVERRL